MLIDLALGIVVGAVFYYSGWHGCRRAMAAAEARARLLMSEDSAVAKAIGDRRALQAEFSEPTR